jgi:hypothetical protein
MLDQIARVCLSHFLCEFDPKSKKRLTRDVVSRIALPFFSADMVDEFIDERLPEFQQVLVEEFNERYRDKRPLRFQIADPAGVGVMVAGYQRKSLSKEIRFQNSLNRATAAEFEKLAAVMLRKLGCTAVFATPSSHDQGIDAFGYLGLVQPTPYGVTHGLTWIAQAKHYRATDVTTGHIRELVGSKELLLAKVFSTVDQRYKELRLRPYAPTAVALITTEEIPSTVRRLADSAGVFVFAASDLFYLLGPSLKDHSLAALRALIKTEAKGIPTLA